jgi:cullin-5
MNTNEGSYDLDVTTYQMCVLFVWNDRPNDKVTFETLRMATSLPDMELRRTLMVCFNLYCNLNSSLFQSLVAFPKLRYQLLQTDCESMNARDFIDSTLFWINQEFAIVKVADA